MTANIENPQVLYISGMLNSCDFEPTVNERGTVVQVMAYVMGDGKSNYLEGIVLLCEFADSGRSHVFIVF